MLAKVPGFLKLLLSVTLVCVCVCPCPHGYKLHSRDIESVQAVEQVCYVYKCNEATMHGRGLCNEARCDRNKLNKAMLVL